MRRYLAALIPRHARMATPPSQTHTVYAVLREFAKVCLAPGLQFILVGRLKKNLKMISSRPVNVPKSQKTDQDESGVAMNVPTATKKKRVNMRKLRNLTVLSVLGVLMIATHQNCAPPSQMTGSATNALYGTDSQVGVIDNVNRNTAVTFAMKELQLNSALSEIALQGQCSLEQEDAVLSWEVRKQVVSGDDEEIFATGQAVCRGGRFSIGLSPTQLLDCGKPYTVKARLGRGTEGSSVVTRACPN